MTGFSTKAECSGLLRQLSETIFRLPVAGTDVLGQVLDAHSTLSAAINALPPCEPSLAFGTHRLRELRHLSPIETEVSNA